MQMLIQVLETLVGLYIYALLLKFAMRAADADFYNPITQAVVKITNPWANLFKFIPAIKRLDLGVFISAIVLQFLLLLLIFAAGGYGLNILTALIVGLFKILLALINLYFWVLIISVILSWVLLLSGNNATGIAPLYIVLNQIMAPILRPIQRILPDLGGIDISPIFAFIGIQVLEYFVKYVYSLVLQTGILGS